MHDFVAASEQTTVAASAEYRHFGDDSALLIVVVQAHGSALPDDARLLVPGGELVAASALTFQPGAGLARIVFAVDRGVASGAGTALQVAIGDELRVRVPEPVKRPAIGIPDGELEHAVAAGVAGDELAGLIRVLERRATIAERVARDLRETRSDATKLAQAYREIWEVRDLLQTREDAHRRAAEAVDAAESAQRTAESAAQEARAELEDVRVESQAATQRLEAELTAARTKHEELETERDDALAAAERLEAYLNERADEVERLKAASAEKTARFDAELASASERFSAELAAAGERFDAELGAAAERLEAELVAAHAHGAELEQQRDAALAQVEAIKRDLADASANVATWAAELDEARTRAADAEALLDAERTLHEARLAARAGSQRQLVDLFAEAQRERLRQTPEEEQQAQVEALERQLARMKQDASGANG